MTKKVSNFTHLIQRVTASCLHHPSIHETKEEEEEEEEEYHGDSGSEGNNNDEDDDDYGLKLKEMEVLMEEVFEGVSRMKRAYVRLQEAHSPWEPEKMRVADVAVVAELKKLAVLRERYFRRRRGGGGGGGGVQQQLRVREVVAPYEAVMDDLKKQLKAKDLQLQGLKDKIESVVTLSSCKCKRKCNGGENKAGRPHPNTKHAFTQGRCSNKSSFDGRSRLRH